MSFETVAVHPAEILLPINPIAPETWACIACDQYTSEPEYWEKVAEAIGDKPSTLKLMLPEYDLKNSAERIPKIHSAMRNALDEKLLYPAVRNGFVLCERTTASGTRLGLVCTVDLEDYDFTTGSLPLIRPTEQTISERLPARLAIRRGAPLELSHILILIDDPGRTVLEPLQARKASLRSLYDFELIMDGGHLSGWALESEDDLTAVDRALNALRLSMGDHPMLLAVGDGNHSLATAKVYWNEVRETLSEEERKNHPARYAMCEIENIHDPALLFEPIHRLLCGVSAAEVKQAWEQYTREHGMTIHWENGNCLPNTNTGENREHTFTLISSDCETHVRVGQPEGAIPCETIQKFLDSFLLSHPEASIDFIHGENSLRMLAHRTGTVGFLLPEIDKNSFFDDVRRLGVLPRKTFSMGEAREKRYYMECRKIE